MQAGARQSGFPPVQLPAVHQPRPPRTHHGSALQESPPCPGPGRSTSKVLCAPVKATGDSFLQPPSSSVSSWSFLYAQLQHVTPCSQPCASHPLLRQRTREPYEPVRSHTCTCAFKHSGPRTGWWTLSGEISTWTTFCLFSRILKARKGQVGLEPTSHPTQNTDPQL